MPWSVWLIAIAGGLGKSPAAAQAALARLPLPESGPNDLRNALRRNWISIFGGACGGVLLAGVLYSSTGYLVIVLVAGFASGCALVQEILILRVLAKHSKKSLREADLSKSKAGGALVMNPTGGTQHKAGASQVLIANLERDDKQMRNRIAYTMAFSNFVYGTLDAIKASVIPLQFTESFGVDPALPAVLSAAGEIFSVLLTQILQRKEITAGPIFSAKCLAFCAWANICLMFPNLYVYCVSMFVLQICLNSYLSSLSDVLSAYTEPEEFTYFAAKSSILDLMGGVVFSSVGPSLWGWMVAFPFAFCAVLSTGWCVFCLSQTLRRTLFLTNAQFQLQDDRLVGQMIDQISRQTGNGKKKTLREYFKPFQLNSQKPVMVEDLVSYIRKEDEQGRWNTPDCRRLMRQIDPKGDGQIGFDELEQFVIAETTPVSTSNSLDSRMKDHIKERTKIRRSSVISTEKRLFRVMSQSRNLGEPKK